MRLFPRDFIETREGLVFAVLAHGEEQGRVLCFLRYIRDASRWRKVSTDQANSLLRSHYPHYCFHSEQRDVFLHGVPVAAITARHSAKKRRKAIETSERRDVMEDKCRGLIALFCRHGLVPQCIGVTGSLLIAAHNQTSDIDLVIYGREAFHRARAILERLVAGGKLQPLDDQGWRDAYRRRGCSLSWEEFLWHERRKNNKAVIDGTKFDLGMVPAEEPAVEVRYRKAGAITIRATVVEDRYAFDYPARYALDCADYSEAVSYTPTYAGQARQGELIEIAGNIEVSDRGVRRIVVGSSREAVGEYIKVVRISQAADRASASRLDSEVE